MPKAVEMVDGKIVCCECKELKDTSDFYIRRRSKLGFTYRCKKCFADQTRRSYCNKRFKTLTRNRVWTEKYMFETKQKLDTIKETLGCINCGQTEPCCISFHHLDKSSKTSNISNLVSRHASYNAIALEIRKCVSICENCHRMVHHGVIQLPIDVKPIECDDELSILTIRPDTI